MLVRLVVWTLVAGVVGCQGGGALEGRVAELEANVETLSEQVRQLVAERDEERAAEAEAARKAAEKPPEGTCAWVLKRCDTLGTDPNSAPLAAALGGEVCGMLTLLRATGKDFDAETEAVCRNMSKYFRAVK